jgi:hypothetical protein
LDITRNTGRNKGCLSVVPGRRGGRRPLMFDVARNMAHNILLPGSQHALNVCSRNLDS